MSGKKSQLLLDTIISVIVVSQNDEDIIEERIREIDSQLKRLMINYEILIIDNNSTDIGINKISTLSKSISHLRIIILSKSYDKDIALTAGLDSCIGDYAILFNMYTDPSEIISSFTTMLLKNYDIVIGKHKNPFKDYSHLSALFLKALEKLSHEHFMYRTNYSMALNRKAINSIIKIRRKSRNFSYINNLIGFKKSIFSYTQLHKYKYKLKKENFFVLFFTATDIIISHSYKPIRIFSFLGIITSILFLVYVMVIGLIYFFVNRSIAPQGWLSLATVSGTMFFLLFSLLTFISEYLIRTLQETRNEPLYFITDEIDKSIILTEQNKLNIV